MLRSFVPRLIRIERVRPLAAWHLNLRWLIADESGLKRSGKITGGEDQSYFVDPHMQVRFLPVALRSQYPAWPKMAVA
jgi:hypothetical protein